MGHAGSDCFVFLVLLTVFLRARYFLRSIERALHKPTLAFGSCGVAWRTAYSTKIQIISGVCMNMVLESFFSLSHDTCFLTLPVEF